ncbi:unnamed protein product, partial [Notodromas monacha]
AIEILLLYIFPGMSMFGDIKADMGSRFHNFRIYGTILLLLLTAIIFGGVRLVNRFAGVALACVLISILAVYIGIAINANGSDYLPMCMLGSRILVQEKMLGDPLVQHQGTTGGGCDDDLRRHGPLFEYFCHRRDAVKNETLPCFKYFLDNNVTVGVRQGIRGLGSMALFESMKTSFVENPGQYVTNARDPLEHHYAGEDPENFLVKTDMKTNFIILVGIFFPSVTGIMAGSNRSGDLKDAQKSIPIGTLSAVVTTSAVYLSAVVLLAGSVDNLLLRDKFGESIGGRLVVANLAWPTEWIVLIGSFLSTIGAGIQSLTGAPRLLQAIARDEIIPFLRPFAESAPNGEPRRALFLTWLICQISVLIGNLDNITPLLSCFFLMCYGFVNLACALQTLLKSPNWRPRFKYYHWSLSITGLALCTCIMFMCSWFYALFAIGHAMLIYKYIEFNGAKKEWGDGIRGLALSAARFALLRLEEGLPHTKNWRPQVLVFVKLDANLVPKESKVLAFASQLKAGKGLTMPVSVIEGDFVKRFVNTQAARINLRKVMVEEKLEGFVEVVVAQNVLAGVTGLIQTAGVGGLKPNTVILGWPRSWQSTDKQSWKVFIETIRCVAAAQMALIVPKARAYSYFGAFPLSFIFVNLYIIIDSSFFLSFSGHQGISFYPDSRDRISGNIDVWWIVHDGGLLMLLPFLLRQHKTWENCRMRIFTVAQIEDNSVQMQKEVKRFLYQLRIDASVEIVEMEYADISAYTYERTLVMEQRAQMFTELKLSRNESRLYLEGLVDQHRSHVVFPPPRQPKSNNKVLYHEQGCNNNKLIFNKCIDLNPIFIYFFKQRGF